MQFQMANGVLTSTPDRLIVAGWTGRDRSAVDHHINELAAIGVPAPSAVPLFYQCSPDLLTQEKTIQVLGRETSGEAEPFLLQENGNLWLGLASDHTDRALETHSVAASKQVSAKPVADRLWSFETIVNHLDDIRLQSWIREKDDWVLYQDGTLASILPLKVLVEASDLDDGCAMLCGTLPAIGGVRPADDFKMALTDPVHERTIEWSYKVSALEIIS